MPISKIRSIAGVTLLNVPWRSRRLLVSRANQRGGSALSHRFEQQTHWELSSRQRQNLPPKLCVAASVGPGKFHQHTKLEIVCQKNSHLALFWSFPVVSPLDSSSLDRKHAGEGNILYLAGAMVSCTRPCIRMFDVGEDFEFDAFDHGCFNMRKIGSTVTWGEQRLIIIGNRFNNTHG